MCHQQIEPAIAALKIRSSSLTSYLLDRRMEPSVEVEKIDTEENEMARLYHALGELDERSWDILQARWLSGKKSTLHELANRYGVSSERIWQIEKVAMMKLKVKLAA